MRLEIFTNNQQGSNSDWFIFSMAYKPFVVNFSTQKKELTEIKNKYLSGIKEFFLKDSL